MAASSVASGLASILMTPQRTGIAAEILEGLGADFPVHMFKSAKVASLISE